MVLSKNEIDQSILIKSKTIELWKSAKLLIDNKLNFGIQINNIGKVASAIIKGVGRIRSRLNLLDAKFYITLLSCLSSTVVASSGYFVVKHYKGK